MVLTRVDSPLDYGIVITDEQGRIVRFLEKPSWGEVFSDTINTGIYSSTPPCWRRSRRPTLRFARSYFPTLLASAVPCMGHVAEGYWREWGISPNIGSRISICSSEGGGWTFPAPSPRRPAKRLGGEGARVDFLAKLSGSVIIGPASRWRGCAARQLRDRPRFGDRPRRRDREQRALGSVDVARAPGAGTIVGTRAQIRAARLIAAGW